MKVKLLAILAILVVGISACKHKEEGKVQAQIPESQWLTDYAQAQAQAKKENKKLLIDFTGSDWCPWCIKLHQEVFSTKEFNEYANKNLVLLVIDFPRSKPLSQAQQSANEKLAQQYNIEGLPTVVVLNGDGAQLGELGYQPGGPVPFIAALEKLR